MISHEMTHTNIFAARRALDVSEPVFAKVWTLVRCRAAGHHGELPARPFWSWSADFVVWGRHIQHVRRTVVRGTSCVCGPPSCAQTRNRRHVVADHLMVQATTSAPPSLASLSSGGRVHVAFCTS